VVFRSTWWRFLFLKSFAGWPVESGWLRSLYLIIFIRKPILSVFVRKRLILNTPIEIAGANGAGYGGRYDTDVSWLR
jgi:hypothetical protein